MKFESKLMIFVEESAHENVGCKKATILSRLQCVEYNTFHEWGVQMVLFMLEKLLTHLAPDRCGRSVILN